MRFMLAVFVATSLALGCDLVAAAKPFRPVSPEKAAIPLKEMAAKFVDADLETGAVHVRDLKGNIVAFRGTSRTVVVRDLRSVRPEAFHGKRGEPLLVRYWPSWPGEQMPILHAVMDAQTAAILSHLADAKAQLSGKLVKVDYPKRSVSVRVSKGGTKMFALGPNAIMLKGNRPAKLEGDPSVAAGAKGRPENVFRAGDSVFLLLTKDKKDRALLDGNARGYIDATKAVLDAAAAEGPPAPSPG